MARKRREFSSLQPALFWGPACSLNIIQNSLSFLHLMDDAGPMARRRGSGHSKVDRSNFKNGRFTWRKDLSIALDGHAAFPFAPSPPFVTVSQPRGERRALRPSVFVSYGALDAGRVLSPFFSFIEKKKLNKRAITRSINDHLSQQKKRPQHISSIESWAQKDFTIRIH